MKFEDLELNIIPLCKKYGVRRMDIFGSFARGNATKESDIDLLVEFEGTKHIFDRYMDLMMELEEKTHRKIDIITYQAIQNPIFKKVIEEERKILYEGNTGS